MNVGDYVFKTENGQIRVVPREVNGRDGRETAGSSDELIGIIRELRDDPKDTIVALESPEPNMAPGYATFETLRENFG